MAKAQANPTTNTSLQQQMKKVQQMLLLIAQQKEITPEFENQMIQQLEEFKKSDNFRVVNAYTRACGLLATMYQANTLETPKLRVAFLSGCSIKTKEVSTVHLAKAFCLKGRPVGNRGHQMPKDTRLPTLPTQTATP
ncbi:MAG: hypothetical protein R2822_08700 [Spirosomataceae bacterium]